MRRTDAPDDFSALSELFARAHDAEPDAAAVALSRKRRRRRRIAGGVVTLVVLAAIGTYVPVTLLAPAPAVATSLEELTVSAPGAVAVALPEAGSSAVSISGAEQFAATAGTDGILAASGEAGPLPIASITKVITAMVILDARPLTPGEDGPSITFGVADEALYDYYYVRGATIQSMNVGDVMTQRDALEVMLIASASNYADAVSQWAFGSRSQFLAATRTWLAERGLNDTAIFEPTGLDPRNTSTTKDLIALGRLALDDPVVSQIVRSPSLDVPGLGRTANLNTLVGIDGISGIKTGTLDEAGSCLLFSAVIRAGRVGAVTVVGVVLGGDDRSSVAQSVRAMLSTIEAGFHSVPVTTRGQALGTYSTPWGETATIVAAHDASVLTWSDTPVTSRIQARPIATIYDGATVGSAEFVAENDVTSVPLLVEGSIQGPDAWWRLTHPVELLR